MEFPGRAAFGVFAPADLSLFRRARRAGKAEDEGDAEERG
jgi:hypothetical protein